MLIKETIIPATAQETGATAQPPADQSKEEAVQEREKQQHQHQQLHDEPESILRPGEEGKDDKDLKIPGPFYLARPPQPHEPRETWGEMFRRLTKK